MTADLQSANPIDTAPSSTRPDSQSRVESTHQVIERIDQTLDLIADATSSAIDLKPLDWCAVTVIVPVYNERKTLPAVLEKIQRVMPRDTEIIVVDDGSTDGTGQWLAEYAADQNREKVRVISRRRNHGKGSAIRLAIRHSRGSVVGIQDADLEYDPADLLQAMWPILDGDAEVVFGSRYLEGNQDRSLLHRFGNRMLTWSSNLTTGMRLTDMETCHKAFDGDLIRSLSIRETRFGFEPEVTAKVAARGARVLELPTGYQGRGYRDGKKIGWRDALAALACIWKYRKG